MEQFYKRYGAYVDSKTTETLIQSFFKLASKAIDMVVKVNDVEALQKDLQKDFVINSTLSSVAGNIALGCGRQLEAANTTLITAKHIEFEKEPDKEPAKEPVKEPEQESCKEADKEPVKIFHILYTWFRNRMHLLRHLPIRIKFKSPFCQKNLRQDQQKTLGEFRLAKSYPNEIAWHVRQKRTKDRQKPPLTEKRSQRTQAAESTAICFFGVGGLAVSALRVY